MDNNKRISTDIEEKESTQSITTNGRNTTLT